MSGIMLAIKARKVEFKDKVVSRRKARMVSGVVISCGSIYSLGVK